MSKTPGVSGLPQSGEREMQPLGFFMIRSPLLPWDELEAWGNGLEAVTAGVSQLPEALARDEARLRTRLRSAVLRPEVREALYVSSPSLESEIDEWLQEPETERGRRVELALARYYQRFCGRATPFGLAAGFSVGALATRNRFVLSGRSQYGRHTRPDMEYLAALVAQLQQRTELSELLLYRPNSSLYEAGGRLRYVECKMDENVPSYFTASVEKTDYLEATLRRADRGEYTHKLIEALVDAEVSLEEARTYIDELIAIQLLVPDLACQVTGVEALPALLATLRQYDKVAPAVISRFQLLQSELASIDGQALGQSPQRYRDLVKQVGTIPYKRQPPSLFQVDLTKPAPGATLGTEVVNEIARGADLLRYLLPEPVSNEFSRFRDTFVTRYEDREVPLLEALDEECGIGFPLAVDETPQPGGSPPPSHLPVHWGPREDLLLRRLNEALLSGANEIVLDPQEIGALRDDRLRTFSDTLAVQAIVASPSADALDRGDFQVLLESMWGASGACKLGRFCHADGCLQAWVEEYIRAEEALQPEAVFAEIVHLTAPRMANIIARPVLRAYEIPYLGRSGAPLDRQLPASDLWLSVRNGRFVLRSARLGREVIPRLTSAHNYAVSPLAVYRFLGGVAHVGLARGAWSWKPLDHAPFLPRVRCGRVVFQRATWNLQQDELRQLDKPTVAERFQAAQDLRERRRLPRRATVGELYSDIALPVDFDNCMSVENFIRMVRRQRNATLTEFFPGPDQLVLNGPEGRFVHELIVPFLCPERKRIPGSDFISSANGVTASQPRPGVLPPVSVCEAFPPGSAWLYAKIYCGPAMADLLLRDVLPGFIEQVKRDALVDRWFFIRYSDPDWHLRLRFHGHPAVLLKEVLPAVHDLLNPYLAIGAVHRWQLDTYRRETQRYGGLEGVELAEEVFEIDSEAVVSMLQAWGPDNESESRRWWVGICGVDRLLESLDLNLEAKLEVLLKKAHRGSANNMDATRKHELGQEFRRHREALGKILGMTAGQDENLELAFAALQARASRLVPVVRRLQAFEDGGRLSAPIKSLSASFMHMHVNRLLRSDHPLRELAIQDALVRLYKSQSARQSAL